MIDVPVLVFDPTLGAHRLAKTGDTIVDGDGNPIGGTVESAIEIQDNGVAIIAAATALNFIGAASLVDAGGGQADITLSTTIAVEDGGAAVASAATLNFIGADSVVDAGGGQVDVTIGGITDHGALSGLLDDDHTQYPLLAGRTGGQTLFGSDTATEGLVVQANSAGLDGTISIPTTTVCTTPATGALVVAGGVGIGGDLCVGGALDVVGTIDVGSITTTGLIATPTGIEFLPVAANPGTATENTIWFSTASGFMQIENGLDMTFTANDQLILDGVTSPRGGASPPMFEIDMNATADGVRGMLLDINAQGNSSVLGIEVNYETGTLTTGDAEAAVLVNVNPAGSTGGRLSGLAIETVDTTTGADLIGLFVGAGVRPIRHDAGSTTFADQGFTDNGGFTDTTADFASGASNVNILDANGAVLYLGHATQFGSAQFVMNTFASGGGVNFTAEYSDGVGGWTSFTVADGTDKLRQDGSITWTVGDLSGWAMDTVNAVSNLFWIRLTRSGGGGGTPVESTISIAVTQEFEWDADGNIFAAGLDLNAGVSSTSTTTGTLTVDGGAGITEDVYVGGDLDIAGKLTVAGLIDPTGLQLDTQVSNPGDANTLWIRTSDGSLMQGATAGVAPTAHTHTLSEVTDSGALAALNTVGTTEIDDSAVTFAKIQDMATGSFLARVTAGDGVVEVLSAANSRSLLNVEEGANNYTHPNHTGDVTSAGDGATTIANDAMTYDKIQNVVANNVFLGNDNGAGSSVQELTATEATALLDVMVGDSGAGGTKGLVPAPGIGDATKLLRGDGTWVTVSGASVTSVFGRTGAVVAATSDYDANQIDYANATSGMTATDVQAAIDEVEGRVDSLEAAPPSHNHTLADITDSGALAALNTVGTTEITDDSVTYAKIQNVVANNVLLGNNAGAGGIVDELTATEVRTLLNVADGANAYVHPNHSGDVTSVGDGATTIANDAVTYAKMQNVVANNVFLGNNSGAGAIVDELTGTEATALLDVMVGDSGAGGTKGLVPAPGVGDATKLLRGDGTWVTIAGASVTSVFGRTGAVVAATSDYDANQIDYANATSGLTATDVQAAIDEVEGRVDSLEAAPPAHNHTLADITDSGALAALNTVGTTEITDDSVTYAKIQNVVANNVLLGNNAGAGGIVDELTATEVRTLLNVADGANNYTHPNHSGDVTSVGDGATTIANDAVTYAKMQNVVANNVLLGNNAGAGGIVDELTATEVRTILNVADGANNYTHPNHSGDVTSVGDGATTIANDAVTYAKMQNVVANNVLLGNNAGAGGIVDELTATEVRTILNVADGANAYTHPNHTGDVTSAGDGATTIANDAVTYTKIQNVVANNVFLGNDNGAGSAVQELTGTEATALLSDFVGDSGAGGTKGLVPAPASGDAAANRFLKADGTWATTPGGGVTDHGALTGLADDDHTQYLNINGRTGGQTVVGSSNAFNHLTTLTFDVTANTDFLAGGAGVGTVLRARGLNSTDYLAATTITVQTDTTAPKLFGTVFATPGETSSRPTGLFFAGESNVLEQQALSKTSISTAFKQSGGFTDITTAVNSAGTDVTLFDANSDYVYIGSTSQFNGISVKLATAASESITPAFSYSNGAGGWVGFPPIDTTQGFQYDGMITWRQAVDLAGWATDTVNAVSGRYWVRIQRGNSNAITVPTEDIMYVMPTSSTYNLHSWDYDGNLMVRSVSVGDDGASSPAFSFRGSSGQAGFFWDSANSAIGFAAGGVQVGSWDAGSVFDLTAGTGTSSLQLFTIQDADGTTAIDLGTSGFALRNLKDTSGTNSMSFTDRKMFDSSSNDSADWELRQLHDGSGTLVGHWGLYQLYDSGSSTSVDWGSRYLVDGSSNSIDWGSRYLLDSSGNTDVEWSNSDGFYITSNRGGLAMDQISAPGAPGTAGGGIIYFDSSDSGLYVQFAGGSAVQITAFS
jgi:hypothetical protein